MDNKYIKANTSEPFSPDGKEDLYPGTEIQIQI